MHASVTLVMRGDSLERSMSRYLIEQIGAKANVSVRPHSEVVAAHGDTNLTAIEIRDSGHEKVSRHDCGGLFVFIGADAETQWLPADIARDDRGYVLTGDDVVKAGALVAPSRPVPPRIERPWHFCVRRCAVEPGEARCRRGRRGEHGDRFCSQVPATGRAIARTLSEHPSVGIAVLLPVPRV
jgi:hypothetical protein